MRKPLVLLVLIGAALVAALILRDDPEPARKIPARTAPPQKEEAPRDDASVALPEHPDATVRVLVKDDTGEPWEDATVRATVTRDGVGMSGPEGQTDAAGRVALEVEADVTSGVGVEVGSYSSWVSVKPRAGRAIDLTVIVKSGGRITGTVRHAVKGPLEGVRISAEYRTGRHRSWLRAETGADGRFALEPVPAGETKLDVAGRPVSHDLDDYVTVRLDAGETVDVGTILVGGARLEGVVLDAGTSRPLPGASVRLADPVRSATTADANGHFEFDDLTPSIYAVSVRKEGYGGAYLRDVDVRLDQPAELEIELQPAALLALEVVDTEDRPVVGRVSLSYSRTGSGLGSGAPVVLDEHGRGTFRGLTPGSYDLGIQRRGYDFARTHFTIEEGENTLRFRGRKRATPGGKGVRSFHGTVRDAATGRPIPGVEIGPNWGRDYTDAEGNYVLADLRPQTYQLTAVRDGYVDVFLRDLALAAGEERRLDLEMQPAVTLDLNIRDAAGRPVAGRIGVFYLRRDGDKLGTNDWVPADESGRAVFRRLRPGPHWVCIRVDGVGMAQKETTIAAGSNELTFRLK